MKKRILVSGGAGYIGSHVTVELIAAGYDVVVADNMSNCDRSCFDGVRQITGRSELPFVEMDFCDAAAVERLFSRYKIDAVIHFAAFKAVGESVAEPIKYYRNNLLSFLNVLEAARNHGGCNVLFSSSATVYGEADKLPVTEQSPRLPATSPYGNTKQICEDMLRDAIAADPSIRGIALRYFNPIGAHPSVLIGELPRGVPNNLVPFITQTSLSEYLRQRLSDAGRHLPAGLHRHRRSGPGPCLRRDPHGRRTDERGLRNIQRGNGASRIGGGTGHRIRKGQWTQAQLQIRRPSPRGCRSDLGRHLPCERRAGLEGQTNPC